MWLFVCSSVRLLLIVVFGDMFRIDGLVDVLFWCLLFMYGSDVMLCFINLVGGVMFMIFELFG